MDADLDGERLEKARRLGPIRMDQIAVHIEQRRVDDPGHVLDGAREVAPIVCGRAFREFVERRHQDGQGMLERMIPGGRGRHIRRVVGRDSRRERTIARTQCLTEPADPPGRVRRGVLGCGDAAEALRLFLP